MASFLSLHVVALFVFSVTTAVTVSQPSSLHFPVSKDPRTGQYYTEIQMSPNITHVNVVIDLTGHVTWFSCDNYNSPSNHSVLCHTKRCKTLESWGCYTCYGREFEFIPQCNYTICNSAVYNPYINLLHGDPYLADRITTLSTDGEFLSEPYAFSSYAFSCARPASLKNLARQTVGMIGLAKTKSSLPRQLSLAFRLPYKFALCLPSSSNNGYGDIFVGGGPYVMSSVIGDLSKSLTTTPILANQVSTGPLYDTYPSKEYFIGVTSIRIDDKAVSLDESLLSFEFNEDGNGGTKLSTIAPYTVLHNSIYRDFARAYVRAAANKNITRVAPGRPFGVCFSATVNGSVPYVDLVLQSDNVKWRFDEANLMVKVNNDVMCLGIRDGGLNPRTAIVLGGLQLENYLIEFDLVSSNLGFSSSLLEMNTSCSHNRNI